MTRTPLLVPLATAAALLAAASPTPAADKGGDDDGRVERTGSCSGSSNWKLKAKPDDGRLEVEFEVDQNTNGVSWRVRIRRNGKLAVNTTRTTRPPSGSFSLERKLGNASGQDTIRAVARREGETCRGSLRI